LKVVFDGISALISGLKYTPTSIIFMKIPSISKLQWHSFSITSSSTVDNQRMSVIVKCDGWWTNSLYDMIQAELDSDADKIKYIPVAIEGPYGPSSMTFLRFAKELPYGMKKILYVKNVDIVGEIYNSSV